MHIKNYINSGVLEEYCMGLLNEHDREFLLLMVCFYPEIRTELNAVELAMENLAIASAVTPAANNRKNILAALGFNDMLDINDLPPTHNHTDYQLWLTTLNHLIPDNPAQDLWMQEIKKDKHHQQMLVYTRMDIPEEQHGEFIESFFILKGHCECKVGDQMHFLSPGDYLEIPMHTDHDIKITSPHVVAILQYEFV